MSKVQNLHYAYLLNEGGKDYGQAGKIENFLASRVKDTLLPQFNQTDFSVQGSNGLSQDSLKALEIFASVQKSPEVGKDAIALITSFIQKVSKQGVQTDNKFSFIGKEVSPVALSKTVLSILNLSGNLDEKISKDQKVGLRNFFVQSASLSHKPCRGVTSLKGLSVISADIPAVRFAADQKKTVSVTDSTKTVKFELVDAYGKPYTKTEGVKVSVADLSDNKATLKDVTGQVKFSNSVATWTIDAKQPIGRYQLIFSVNGYTVSAPSVTVSDKIKFSSVQYSVVQKSSIPSKFDGKIEYPKSIEGIRQGQDDYFIHLAIDAGFTKSSEKPSQVFFSLRRKSSEKSLAINSYGKLNKDSGLYEVSVDISKDFDQHFNGDY